MGGGGLTLYQSPGQARLQVIGVTSSWKPKHTTCKGRQPTSVLYASGSNRIIKRDDKKLQAHVTAICFT
jgi:hypothetical protein